MLSTLARASVDGAILVAVVWVLCRMLPRLSAGTRTLLWWCAAAKFVVSLTWTTPVQIPVLPPPAAAAVAETHRGAVIATTLDNGGNAVPRTFVDWPPVLVVAWAAGFVVVLSAAFRRWQRTRAIMSAAIAAPPEIQQMAVDLGGRIALGRVPDVRVSSEVSTPLVAGLLRPVVLLPADRLSTLTSRQQQLALCHELWHVRRADLWLGLVPALAERAFFFHPLARAAAGEYAFWREAACDAAVLDALGAAPQEYGQLLLDLGISRPQASLAAAGASWSFSSLRRRIVMLGETSNRTWATRLVAAGVLALAIAAIVPLQLTARQSWVSAASTALDAARPLTGPADWNRLAPSESTGPQRESDLNYVMLRDEDHITMSGSHADVDRARRFQRDGEPLLWFRKAGREYVIRDQATLRQVEALWQPVHVIGEHQGQVGEQQGEIGEKQGAIGEKQGEVGEAQGDVGERQGKLGEKLGQLGEREASAKSPEDRQAIEVERRAIDQKMRELDKEMAVLDEKMRALDQPMRELDAEMRVLDGKMRELDGRMRDATARAEGEMRALIDRAITTGAAQAVK